MPLTHVSYQHRDAEGIEEHLIKDFENVCDWFVNNEAP